MSKVYLQAAKYGDICSILPILYDDFKQTGKKSILIISKEYAANFQCIDYITVDSFDGNWQDLSALMLYGKRKYGRIITTQTHSNDFDIEKRQASFQLDQWERAGMLHQWDKLPLIIPRPRNANTIVKKYIKKKRAILYGDHSQSSPFPQREQLAALLVEHFGKTYQILRLSEVNLENPLDLLVLYDAADLLVTIETLHIHLAKASDVPMAVLATDTPGTWNGSAGSRRFGFYCRYNEFPKNANELVGALTVMLEKGRQPQNSTFKIRRTAAIGDVLCSTIVADRMVEMGHQVEFQTHHDIKCVVKRCPKIGNATLAGGFAHVNLDKSYEADPERKLKHFHQSFFESANAQLANYGINLGRPLNAKPVLVVSGDERGQAMDVLKPFPRPWVFICPRSNAHSCRTVPDGIWQQAAQEIQGTKFWLGTKTPAPSGIVDLKLRHLDNVVSLLSVADLMVTVDTGPMHIAAALGVPIVGIQQQSSPDFHLSDQRDFITIGAPLDCINCCQAECPINKEQPPCQNVSPKLIADAANKRLASKFGDGISAVVAIYRPDGEVLNRCLNALIPQVSEIVVAVDTAGKVPIGALQHPKIRYVLKHEHDTGYGRKSNFGVRHTNGRYVLLCNDDVELEGDAVARMMDCMKPEVGMVSCLLRYRSNGLIQHAGKVRKPGEMGWGHIDLNQQEATIKEPQEHENTCGACILVRREAFYQAGCHDESYFLYCEDDDLCLSMRKLGWKIMFTPHAKGIHDEHHSTWTTPRIQQIMLESNAIFGRKWGKYLEHNANRIPGNFDYDQPTA
jgi:GT2 family glycosyltransferase/ADP-heptose:LPS heptosyltransferase